MFSITQTARAQADLQEVWQSLGAHNPEAADALLDTLGQRCRAAVRDPFMGRSREELAPELRSVAVGRYVIFYQPQEDGIEVVRVLHASHDLTAIP